MIIYIVFGLSVFFCFECSLNLLRQYDSSRPTVDSTVD